MDIIIGYFKITPYIFEIEILYVHSDNRDSMSTITNEQRLNATYYVIIFKVISIKHMVTQMLYELIFDYKIGKIYEEFKSYYLTYDRAFNEKFFDNNEFKLFKHGYAGLYNVYDVDGKLVSTFYHINGKIEGEKLIYTPTYRKDSIFSTKVKILGKYKLVSDTLSPKITISKPIEGKWINQDTVQLQISDSGSGIKKYDGYLNGRWVLFEYDNKTRTITHYFNDDFLQNGANELKVIVTDAMGNSTTFETHFFRNRITK